MNRVLVFGIAIFFAVVGIALLGGDSKAVAGHGCHGCSRRTGHRERFGQPSAGCGRGSAARQVRAGRILASIPPPTISPIATGHDAWHGRNAQRALRRQLLMSDDADRPTAGAETPDLTR